MEQRFGPLHVTFRVVSFALVIAQLYPNPKNDVWRRNVILLILLSTTPVAGLVMLEIITSWMKNDLANIVRHSTVFVPYIACMAKMLITYKNRVEAAAIIHAINDDLASFNDLDEDDRTIVEEHIKSSKFFERIWAITMVNSVFIFPFIASLINIYNTLSGKPQREMIHEVTLPFLDDPEMSFESPYFEILFISMLYFCVLFYMNFLGYDGFFVISINHACLKMVLYCRALEKATRSRNGDVIYRAMVDVIRAQNNMFKYVEMIKRNFNFWLGLIFVLTTVHICNCMYQITEGLGFDLRYIVFTCGSVIHIFVPCWFSGKLKLASLETATQLYCSGWEHTASKQALRSRRLLLFMIARAQMPISVTVYNMLTIDVELFVSIMHSSYSMFTLLRS